MKLLTFCSVLFFEAVAGCVSLSDRPTSAVLNELAPTGKLRVGVVVAPAKSAFFAVKEANGQPRGVTVDLGTALAQKLGVPVEFMIAPNSGEVTDALTSGALDVTFMPADDERRKRVDFGPVYYVSENTYLVPGGSAIKTLADVDRPNMRVIGIANTTTIRTAGRLLKNAKITAANSVDEALEILRSGKADAFALTREALRPLASRLPGSRILDGAFQQLSTAVAVPKNRPNALAYVTDFMENAKASGIVRQAFDNADLKDFVVAPPTPPR
jgi:polar amino acid transport system substrate-binding protein